MVKLSEKQTAMLKSFRDDGLPLDLDDFAPCGTLEWVNRQRVIDALRRKGLLDAGDKVTEAGMIALSGH